MTKERRLTLATICNVVLRPVFTDVCKRAWSWGWENILKLSMKPKKRQKLGKWVKNKKCKSEKQAKSKEKL